MLLGGDALLVQPVHDELAATGSGEVNRRDRHDAEYEDGAERDPEYGCRCAPACLVAERRVGAVRDLVGMGTSWPDADAGAPRTAVPRRDRT